jgi:hypothetical protein
MEAGHGHLQNSLTAGCMWDSGCTRYASFLHLTARNRPWPGRPKPLKGELPELLSETSRRLQKLLGPLAGHLHLRAKEEPTWDPRNSLEVVTFFTNKNPNSAFRPLPAFGLEIPVPGTPASPTEGAQSLTHHQKDPFRDLAFPSPFPPPPSQKTFGCTLLSSAFVHHLLICQTGRFVIRESLWF